MSDNSSIEWCDATWNFLVGCDRVSPGCDQCYAITTANIRQHNPNPKVAAAFAGTVETRDGSQDWTGRVNIIEDRLSLPLRWRKPRKVFVNSLSDLFHEMVPTVVIARAFAVMVAAPQHTYQILTKRHGRMRSLLSSERFWIVVAEELGVLWRTRPPARLSAVPPWIWLGVSVEDQKRADLRIPALLATPAAVRWLSCEPLLGPVDLSRWLGPVDWPECWDEHGPSVECARCIQPQWVVVGGESGHGARPMDPQWARNLLDQCQRAGIPFLFKQWGNWVPPSEMPNDTFIDWDLIHGNDMVDRDIPVRASKKRAGRLLDGRTWDEYPESVTA